MNVPTYMVEIAEFLAEVEGFKKGTQEFKKYVHDFLHEAVDHSLIARANPSAPKISQSIMHQTIDDIIGKNGLIGKALSGESEKNRQKRVNQFLAATMSLTQLFLDMNLGIPTKRRAPKMSLAQRDAVIKAQKELKVLKAKSEKSKEDRETIKRLQSALVNKFDQPSAFEFVKGADNEAKSMVERHRYVRTYVFLVIVNSMRMLFSMSKFRFRQALADIEHDDYTQLKGLKARVGWAQFIHKKLKNYKALSPDLFLEHMDKPLTPQLRNEILESRDKIVDKLEKNKGHGLYKFLVKDKKEK